MIELNLVYPEKSRVKFKTTKFPDGQQQITIDPYISHLGSLPHNIQTYPIIIKSRLNNFRNLELIICTVKALQALKVERIHLYVPYFLGSRSDRKFEDGSTNYLKDVICPIINSLNLASVTVLDPHSDVLEACLNNFIKKDNYDLIKFAKEQLYSGWDEFYHKAILVSPDAGSLKKLYSLAKYTNYTGDILVCSKTRSSDGKITNTEVPILVSHRGKDFIIIDDICDGGSTFVNIGKRLKAYQANDPHAGKNYLIVTHGIFSKGLPEIHEYFNKVFCTNSYSDAEPVGAQLNVF